MSSDIIKEREGVSTEYYDDIFVELKIYFIHFSGLNVGSPERCDGKSNRKFQSKTTQTSNRNRKNNKEIHLNLKNKVKSYMPVLSLFFSRKKERESRNQGCMVKFSYLIFGSVCWSSQSRESRTPLLTMIFFLVSIFYMFQRPHWITATWF